MTDLITSLRSLSVLVLHPRDSDADDLIQQLNRIGCSVETIWPPPETLPASVDVVFVEIKEAISPVLTRLLSPRPDQRPTLIGVIAYENPSVLAGILELDVQAVISKPLRAFGVMSSILMARRVWERQREALRAEEKLRQKLEQVQIITEAKFILMRHHGIDENEAYKIIRSHAMARRSSTVDIANAIINADGLLSTLKVKK
ncbi:ANTAR domain-containing response regulator [Pontitalea aquivivens]|uniref:ANTAR domain-containing response regulator n=1 Tax=Pontitalea aquivivens TaxID=3388663 RepID=UPI003970A0B7